MTDDFWGEPIHVYSRAQAIADGTLVELPEAVCREAGFRIPVCVTRAVWESCIHWPDDEAGLQMESGRLWDVLWMSRMAAARSRDSDRVTVSLHVVPRGGDASDEQMPPLVNLIMHIGPGDTPEPVITIMQPDED